MWRLYCRKRRNKSRIILAEPHTLYETFKWHNVFNIWFNFEHCLYTHLMIYFSELYYYMNWLQTCQAPQIPNLASSGNGEFNFFTSLQKLSMNGKKKNHHHLPIQGLVRRSKRWWKSDFHLHSKQQQQRRILSKISYETSISVVGYTTHLYSTKGWEPEPETRTQQFGIPSDSVDSYCLSCAEILSPLITN